MKRLVLTQALLAGLTGLSFVLPAHADDRLKPIWARSTRIRRQGVSRQARLFALCWT